MKPNTKPISEVYKELKVFSKMNKKSDFFYHYTTLVPLLKIIDSKVIRFSDCKYLNDTSELDHGLKKVRDLLQKEIEKLKKSQLSREVYRNKLFKLLGGLSPIDPEFPSHYVFCLCEKIDLLSQWRGYSKDKCPIALKFRIERIGSIKKCPNTFLFKVIYNEEKQDKIITKIVENFLQSNCTEKEDEEKLLFQTKLALFLTAIYFKHHGFEEEQEWRFMYFCNPKKNKSRKIHFDNSKELYLFPYVTFEFSELFPKSKGNAIKEITVGPQRHSLSKRSLSEYLELNNINIPVVESKIPYRT